MLAWRELQCLSGAVANESPPCFFQSCTFAMAQFALPYPIEHAVVGDVVHHAQLRFGIRGGSANVPRSADFSARAKRKACVRLQCDPPNPLWRRMGLLMEDCQCGELRRGCFAHSTYSYKANGPPLMRDRCGKTSVRPSMLIARAVAAMATTF